jgi:hypothetical protein
LGAKDIEKVNSNIGCSVIVSDLILTGAACYRIGPGVGISIKYKDVIPALTVQGIITCPANDVVVIIAAVDGIVADAAVQAVVVHTAVQNVISGVAV